MASRLLLIAALLAGGVIACGGDDDDEQVTGSRTPTASRVSLTPTQGSEKTPGPDETPIATRGATAPPAAPQGTPATEPPDSPAYLSQFLGRTDLGEEGCMYSPSTRLTDCGNRGIYSVNPPLGGQDISCFITIVDGNPEYITCTSAEPAETKWYDIQ